MDQVQDLLTIDKRFYPIRVLFSEKSINKLIDENANKRVEWYKTLLACKSRKNKNKIKVSLRNED